MTQTLNLYTMQTLFEQPVEPVDFIVEGLLAPGLYILGGSPKVGKSWLALQLCPRTCYPSKRSALSCTGRRPAATALPCVASHPNRAFRALPLRAGATYRTRTGAATGTYAGRASGYLSRYSGHLAKGALCVRQRDVLRFRLPGCGGAQEHRRPLPRLSAGNPSFAQAAR